MIQASGKKLTGVISRGPYEGQRYWVVKYSVFPRWCFVHLWCDDCDAVREVRVESLEAES